MKVGIIGLGRMGMSIGYRLAQAGHEPIGFDMSDTACANAVRMGIEVVDQLEQVPQRVALVWLMVPAGQIVDQVIGQLMPYMDAGGVIIDGGNSLFSDSIRRANTLHKHGIEFIDCGTSGGLLGKDLGFCLMIGGKKKVFDHLEPIFKAVAALESYALVGPYGAGHYVKMVHNGIEYALLQAYAEGLDLLRHGEYKQLNLETISGIWARSSVIRSWILELAHTVFKQDQEFANISGKVAQGGTGLWTVQEAQRQQIAVPLIKKSVEIREESSRTGGTYATKLIALLRNQFGGHAVQKIDEANE